MAQKTLTARLKQKYDTATNWTTNNPVLLAGELGFESDTGKFKIGDGTTAWNSLSYVSTGSGGTATDVQINGTSITSNNVANIRTNGTYNSSTNKIATMSDLPSAITEISTQYIRITDLGTGVYKLTYNGTKYLYYSGTTLTSTHTVAGGAGAVILTVNRYSTTYWHWYYINGSTGYETIYFGYTSSSTGSTSSKPLNSLLTNISSYVKNNLDYSTSNTTYALSAYQGHLLNQNKQDKLPTTTMAGKVLKSTSTAGVMEWGDAGQTTETDPVFSASASAGITSSDITAWNGAKTNSSGTNWIRYENGIQICWGFYDHGSNINDKSGIVVNFPVSFKSGTTPTFLETSGKLDGNAANRTTQANYYALSNTSVSFGWYGGTARSAGWLAIGLWK